MSSSSEDECDIPDGLDPQNENNTRKGSEPSFAVGDGCEAKQSIKDSVHKCMSDPSCKKPTTTTRRYPSGGAMRKCVLTLDGYSYMIGKRKFSSFNIYLPVFLLFLFEQGRNIREQIEIEIDKIYFLKVSFGY